MSSLVSGRVRNSFPALRFQDNLSRLVWLRCSPEMRHWAIRTCPHGITAEALALLFPDLSTETEIGVSSRP